MAKAQLALMETVNAPVAAWERFARELDVLLREVLGELEMARGPAAGQLREGLAMLEPVIRLVSEKLAS